MDEWTPEERIEFLDLLTDFWPGCLDLQRKKPRRPEDESKRSNELANAWIRRVGVYPFRVVLRELRSLYDTWDQRPYPKPRHLELRLKDMVGLRGKSAEDEHWKRRVADLSKVCRKFTAIKNGKSLNFLVLEEGLLDLESRRLFLYSDMSQKHRELVVHHAIQQVGEIRPEELSTMTHAEFIATTTPANWDVWSNHGSGLATAQERCEFLNAMRRRWEKNPSETPIEFLREPGEEG